MFTLSDSKSTSGTATRMYCIFLFLHVEIKFNERGSNFLNTQSSVSNLVASVVIRKHKICLQAYVIIGETNHRRSTKINYRYYGLSLIRP